VRIRTLALSPIPIEGAGCRFRIGQYLPFLASRGIDVTIEPFFDARFFRVVYEPGRFFRKAALTTAQTLQRLRQVATARRYDIVFVYREALPLGPAVLEYVLSAWQRRPMVFDFDDAVFLPNVSDANRIVARLKWPRKTAAIVSRSTETVAGNQYLADYARLHTDPGRVSVIPTSVDTNLFVPRSGTTRNGPPVVGWIGTPTTAGYLQSLATPLARLARRRPFVLRVSGAYGPLDMPGVTVEYVKWSLDGEVGLFNGCDAGVYPLSDDAWTRGKCGFKAIQFMACGVPVVAAAVGVNREIVTDGANGFLASTEDEWVEKLDALLADGDLRRRFGAAGRQTISERYSLAVTAPALEAVLRRASGIPLSGG
jgi:glycosyltransferase involved in cell wall biosynthesis